MLIYRVIFKIFFYDNLVCYKVIFFFLFLSDFDNLGCYKFRLYVFLCVDEEELFEFEEDFFDF